MIGAPGSTVWLLGHELRLMWRRIGSGNRKRRRIALGLSFILPVFMLLVVGLPVGLALREVELPRTHPVVALMAAVGFATAFTLMLSQTLAAAIDALYERNDLDLLFSSPLHPRHVMTVRFLGVAVGVFWTFAYFVGGPLIGIAIMGFPQWLGALLVLMALALAAAGVGLLLAAGLFRLIGPRRTRTVAQVLAALIGAAFFLGAQARTIFGEESSGGFYRDLAARATDPSFTALPGLDWPLRASMGEPLPLLGMFAGGALLFGLANAWLGPRFAEDAAAAAGAGARGGRRKVRAGEFASGLFAATLRKELRLLVRDPALLTQVLLRVLYMLPLAFLLLRQAGDENRYAIPGAAAGLVLMAGQVAGSLAWITVSAEDAPDLLKSAPASEGQIGRAKLAAALLPVALMLAPALLPLLVVAPVAGIAAILGCGASVVSCALLHLWWQTPGKRSEFRRRGAGGWVTALSTLMLGLLFGGATALFSLGWPFAGWGLMPAAVGGAAVLLFREVATLRRNQG